MLKIHNVTGGYSRLRPVIHQLTFSVQPGELVGLIGLNGAGKSTTIKHILGLLTPFSGQITIDGKSCADNPAFFRSQVAYIPESPQFYDELTLWEHLELTAIAYRLPKENFVSRAEHLLSEFQMKKARDWFPSTFSKGMQQKIMILSAFLIEANYLIIDEPFIGLDPLAIQSLLNLLQQAKERGTGILMSTHILSMAETYADRFLIMHDGRIRMSGTLADIQEQLGSPGATLEDCFLQVVKPNES